MLSKTDEDFVVVFFDTTEDLYGEVGSYERQGLAWKGLFHKVKFMEQAQEQLDQVKKKVDQLVLLQNVGIRETRSVFEQSVSENGQQLEMQNLSKFQSFVDEQGARLTAVVNEQIARLKAAGVLNEVKRFAADIEEFKAEQLDLLDENQGYQPYAKFVVQTLDDQIQDLGVDELNTYNRQIDAEISALSDEIARTVDQVALDHQQKLTRLDASITDSISQLITKSNGIFESLLQEQSDSEEESVAMINEDLIGFVTMQNMLWKDISDMIKVIHSEESKGEDVLDHNRIALFSVSDGNEDYDPYGFTRFGFGFGYAQAGFTQIQEQIKKINQAKDELEALIQQRLHLSTEEVLAGAQDLEVALTEELDQEFESNCSEVHHSSLQNFESAKSTISNLIEQATHKIQKLRQETTSAIQKTEEQLKWAVSSIYNLKEQTSLNEALSQSAERVADLIEKKYTETMQKLEDLGLSNKSQLFLMIGEFKEAIDEVKGSFNAERQTVVDDLNAFLSKQEENLKTWEEEEWARQQAVIYDFDSAWNAVLESYCIEDEDGRVRLDNSCIEKGNTGYKKGFDIENHVQVLSLGQDSVDIDVIKNPDKMIKHAVSYTMEGVQAFSESLMQDLLIEINELKETIEEARVATYQALRSQLEDAFEQLHQTVESLTQMLNQDQLASVGYINNYSDSLLQALIKKQEQILKEIKELVWRHSLVQDYQASKEDDHDYELQLQIVQKKQSFRDAIVMLRENLQQEIKAEKSRIQTKYQAQKDQFSEIYMKIYDDINNTFEAIREDNVWVMQEMWDKLEQQAEDLIRRFNSFTDQRLEDWSQKYEFEHKNAKYQQDSYYRYNFLRLLQFKQEGIDQALADATEEFHSSLEGYETAFSAFIDEAEIKIQDLVQEFREKLVLESVLYDSEFERISDEFKASFDNDLQDSINRNEEALDLRQNAMKESLLEIYNFNSFSLEDKSNSFFILNGNQQHQSFMSKFSLYFKDSLLHYDATIDSIAEESLALKNDFTNKTFVETLSAQHKLEELQAVLEDSMQRLVKSLLQSQATERKQQLRQLDEERLSFLAKVEMLLETSRKNFIVDIHVERYAGDSQPTQFAFNTVSGSSKFTGIDELDMLQMPHSISLAQVEGSSSDLEDTFRVKQKQFDQEILDYKIMFRTDVDEQIEGSQDKFDQLEQKISQAVDESFVTFKQSIAQAAETLKKTNKQKRQQLEVQIAEKADPIRTEISQTLAKVQDWFKTRFEWSNQLYDENQRAHIVIELQNTLKQSMESLTKRLREIDKTVKDAQDQLDTSQSEIELALEQFQASQSQSFTQIITDLQTKTYKAIQAAQSAFKSRLHQEQESFELSVDAYVKVWAYWLKYVYDWAPYEAAMYTDYSDTEDYSDQYQTDYFYSEALNGSRSQF